MSFLSDNWLFSKKYDIYKKIVILFFLLLSHLIDEISIHQIQIFAVTIIMASWFYGYIGGFLIIFIVNVFWFFHCSHTFIQNIEFEYNNYYYLLVFFSWLFKFINHSIIVFLVVKMKKIFIMEKQFSEMDSLTGLLNKRIFEYVVMTIININSRKNMEFSIIYIDVDNFKNVNDTYGHNEGDNALREVSKLLLKNVRIGDFVCRAGGDEFIIFISDTDLNKLSNLVKRLKDIMDNNEYFKNKKITLSVGAILYNYNNMKKNITDLIDEADKAMFFIKRDRKDNYLIIDKSV